MMDREKQKLTPEQLKDVTGGESAWWTGDDPAYLYICQNCWLVYGSGETPSPCPSCGSTDIAIYIGD